MSNEIAIQSLREKIDELNQQAWEARVTDFPKAFQLSEESVKLARNINYTKGLAEGLRSLGFGNVRLFKNDEAAPLLREALSLFQSLNDIKGQAVVYEYLGIIERNWGNLGTSLELLLKGYALIQQIGSLEIEVTCCYHIGVTYKHLGNHENALDYLYKALAIAKSSGNILMEAYATNIIGSIYFDNGDYNHALDCYQRGLVIRQESNDKWGEAGSLDNIGFTYLKLNDLDKAIDYCKQSLIISQNSGDKKGEANALLHLAEIYEQAGDIKQASKFSNESLEIRKARGDKRGEAEVLIFLANLYKNRNDVEDHQIFEWLSGALKIADEIKAQDLLSNTYYNLHEYYQQKGDFKESLVQLEAHFQIEKELHKNSINQKIANLEISHKAEVVSQRNKELTELNEKIEKANEELKIERSLERVRTAAMAMKEPADMLDVCKIISDQLEILDVKKIRNIQTAIFYEEKSSYMNYEYYAKHDKLLVTEVDYNNHPVAEKFANQMLKGPNQVWTHGFKGEEVKDWLDYQRSTNVFIDTYLETSDSLNYYWYSLGPVALGMSTYVPLNENEIDLFKRFRNVFELAYRRYQDIEKAQAQAREAQIEAAVEKVRSRSLAMHKSDELQEVVHTVFERLKELNVDFYTAIIILFTEDSKDIIWWLESKANQQYPKILVPYTHISYFNDLFKIRENGGDLLSKCYPFDEKNELFHHLFENTDFKYVPEKQKQFLLEAELATMSVALARNTGIHITSYSKKSFSDQDNQIVKRFANVFDQAYTRFLDLQKAEAQAREAKIETALERTRTQSMIMQHSKELDDTLRVFHQQVLLLGINSAFSFLWLPDEDKDRHIFWAAWGEDKNGSTVFKSKAINYPLDRNEPATAQCLVDWKSNEPVYSYRVPPAAVENYFAAWQELIDGVEKLKPEYFSGGLYYVEAFMKYGCFGVMAAADLTKDEKKTLSRFANEFERTYTRFLDLQKAEAQAREAQIELGLERVRARAMAMQNSDELNDLVEILFEELTKLDLILARCIIWIFDNDTLSARLWMANSEDKRSAESYYIKRLQHSYYEAVIKGWKERDPKWVYDLKGDEKKTIDKLLLNETELFHLPDAVKNGILNSEHTIVSGSFNNFGLLEASGPVELSAEQMDIVSRFAKVFDLTYTRFNDLKQAEAQARDAQIEAALEKVRAKVMAMSNSKDLNETSLVFGEQLRKLGIEWQFSYFWLVDEAKNENTFWITWPDHKTSFTSYTLAEAEQYFNDCLISWRAGVKIHDNYVPPERVQNWLDTFQRIADNAGGEAKRVMVFDTFSKGVYYYDAMMKYGSFGICICKPATDEEKNIQCRFAIEFERAYTRFLDLQKAEAQAREAKIETALERVRARALAMQEPEELKEVAEVLRVEMGLLGVEELETCSIYINDESAEKAECWYALKDIKAEGKKLVNDHFALNLNDTWVGREMLQFYRSPKKQISIVMQGANRKEWIRYCEENSALLRGYYGEVIPDRTYHLYKFSHGAIGAAAAGDISEESWRMLRRAASVFSLAYSRFKDLTQARTDLIKLKEEKKRAEDALTELQATQKQLIQSEKMASLGELTAGIAHEIQNPLNFVNNFSDVSNELLEEMKTELEKGNTEGAKEIALDVKENLEKILHHGKRADAIVKGMLQHSRSSGGQKELTDINTLAEEYLRLAYHGLRAKDKFFNAKFDTDLDRSIAKINIVPQEIGRVILNLINNSFYAVSEKKKKTGNGYEPMVIVTTKAVKPPLGGLGVVEIRVIDNGNGIPQKDLDKIFQPFYTTKPTGQGTGLGLSLSYDIVTKGHDGEIKVETKEGEGSSFIISLPMK